MTAMKSFWAEHGSWWMALGLCAAAFAATAWGSTHPESNIGIQKMSHVLVASIVLGFMLGFFSKGNLQQELSKAQCWGYRFLSFGYYAVIVLVGGGCAIAIFA